MLGPHACRRRSRSRVCSVQVCIHVRYSTICALSWQSAKHIAHIAYFVCGVCKCVHCVVLDERACVRSIQCRGRQSVVVYGICMHVGVINTHWCVLFVRCNSVLLGPSIICLLATAAAAAAALCPLTCQKYKLKTRLHARTHVHVRDHNSRKRRSRTRLDRYSSLGAKRMQCTTQSTAHDTADFVLLSLDAARLEREMRSQSAEKLVYSESSDDAAPKLVSRVLNPLLNRIFRRESTSEFAIIFRVCQGSHVRNDV